jgi:uncharacterized protein (TIGR00159 family)
LLEPLTDVGITGAIDIALMAVLVYLGLLWLQRRRAGNVLRGLLLLGVGYLVARLVGLQLVVAAMEAFFVVAFLAAVLLYRDEVRRVVERIARLGRRDRRRTTIADETELRVIVDTMFELAEDHIGALVVLEGSEPLEPHLDGGLELDGVLSRPLLESLFDPSSDGHDGAVVIRERRLARFGAHLPLSTNFDALGARGTRHAAALGLAEVSDAFCIVVSEERGQVSLAYRGELRPLTQPGELEADLRAFLDREGREPERKKPRLDGTLAATAVLVAIAAWLVLVYGSRPTQRSYVVPVRIADVAPGLGVGVLRPDQVRVTLGGPLRDFYFVSEDDVRVVVSAARMPAGPRAVNLTSADVTIPPSLLFRGVSPNTLTLRLDPDKNAEK